MNVVVIGGGVGGLSAAIRLSMLGHRVQLLEARSRPGGLASNFQSNGLSFDGGPYILLDRPGLDWSFEKLGIDISALDLIPVRDLYSVEAADRPPIRISLDEDVTVAGIEAAYPGAGVAYRRMIAEAESIRRKLSPLLFVSRPNLLELARRGSLTAAPFLLRSLAGVMEEWQFPREVLDAVTIWTRIAGLPLEDAPSVMAFVPALIHRVGAFVPRGGMGRIPELLEARARECGVEIRCGAKVRRVITRGRKVVAVETEDEQIPCDATVSDTHGVGTYLELVDDVPARVKRRVAQLPLQSPGLCAYIEARGEASSPYLRFRIDSESRFRLLVSPAVVDGTMSDGERFPLRLITPMDHAEALRAGEEGQSADVDRLVEDEWWREGLSTFEVIERRTVRGWGREMNLYRDSINPAMTRWLMIRGRFAHRSPWVEGLYLAGSSTHPGQWVSFCAISGTLAAEALDSDGRKR